VAGSIFLSPPRVVIPTYVPLFMTFLAVALALFGTTSPAPISQLPATLPGLGRDEGVFLVTAADDGSRVVYFVAQNARHAILQADLQVEQQLNALWPVRVVSRDEALAYAEGAPVGSARAGLVSVPVAESPVDADAPVNAEAETDAEPTVYVLKPGDNLTFISRAHGTTVEAILQANGLPNANRIYAGQALVIPGAAGPLVAEAPAPAEQPAVADGTYTVKRGDSAIAIARQLGVEVDALLVANGVINRNRIYVGQVLTVPGQSS
jgi:LysM repeat protein